MSSVSNKYAKALFDYCSDQVYDDFSNFISLSNINDFFLSYLSLPIIGSSEKKDFLSSVGFVSDFVNYVIILVEDDILSQVHNIYKQYKRLVYEKRNLMQIYVYSISEITKSQEQYIGKITRNMLNKDTEFEIENIIDRSLINGFIIKAENYILDISGRKKIECITQVTKDFIRKTL
ncbi:MAG: ATP synthase F1, delta subunit [Candidatus Xenolissoclinum pacificiensis L6]|uniref:ATP synthase subunit delta n=1 Tax=Candidatus Xenolissoclinum pacificiensis L6 TaxID=1401685 RepID=W2V258_9RICK|nr:MAG: ATP synthase F1, delta subunit [Candidatus Xenolissoclinum pacificiensis L6]